MESSFDKKSRENYFEMLKIAMENLSIVYERGDKQEVLVHEK